MSGSGTGTPIASTVRYATAAELRSRLDVAATVHDTVLNNVLEAASRAIDGVCNRPDGFLALTTATERNYRGDGERHLGIDECVEITAVVETDSDGVETALDADDYEPYRGSYEFPVFSAPYTAIMRVDEETWTDDEGYASYSVFTKSRRPNWSVTARWGYADAIPALVREATVAQAARWWMRGRSAWSDVVIAADGKWMAYRQTVDPDIAMMLDHAKLIRAGSAG
jgi:hypothetical protein